MAMYEYRCEDHGRFALNRPMSSAAGTAACPVCGRESTRVVSAPMLRTGSRRTWMSAIDHAEKSRHEPEVVTSLPPGSRGRQRMIPLTPALRGLPRP